MKLSPRIIDVVRGIGGAAILCAAGCGGAQQQQQASVASPEEIALVTRHSVPPKPEPAAEVEQETETSWTYPDVHPACGRG